MTSISGCSYYLVLLDDFTHFCSTYPLRCKFKVHQLMADFIRYVRIEFNLPIKCFQGDNETEFVNSAMHPSLAANGIVLHLLCPYIYPQNGKVEQVIRTVDNSMRTLLIHAVMPPSYWAEALAAATCLLNHRPSSFIGNEIPYTHLHKTCPSYEHMRVFGCLCYPNLHATTQHKIHPPSTTHVFQGYPMSHKGYHCLYLYTWKIIISHHVVFDESTFHFTKEPPVPTHLIFYILQYGYCGLSY